MARAASPSYISSTEVEQMILSSPNPDSFLIIDVRTSDFPGGNLPRALWLSSRLFSSPASVQSIISTHIKPRLPQGLNTVITHCMRSQYRGPMAAQALSEHDDWPERVQVKILDGGYRGWEKKYRGRKELFEGLGGEKGDVVGLRREGVAKDELDQVEELHSVELRKAKGE
ncbi:BQ5605_C008g05057 [Microbotryum silenes-dioicae]|uniref:BQ5605_C008g05057 protein n=1 Tax=Microbotryum silenes-dioicae TaxID=796604 RepID=A0A2X0N5Y5_9BASI|nr:BQ5605_C008g05057 [Microbotryum silenes-dioicae]